MRQGAVGMTLSVALKICLSVNYTKPLTVSPYMIPLKANGLVDCVVPAFKHLSGNHMAASLMIDGFTHSEFQMELQKGDVQTKPDCFPQ